MIDQKVNTKIMHSNLIGDLFQREQEVALKFKSRIKN